MLLIEIEKDFMLLNKTDNEYTSLNIPKQNCSNFVTIPT